MTKRIPEGPPGQDIETCEVAIPMGTVETRIGSTVRLGKTVTRLLKLRRCADDSVFGMVEYPDGSFLWTMIAAAPIPELMEHQKAEIDRMSREIPRTHQVLGDWSQKIGDRTSIGDRMGTIVFMASARPAFAAGSVIAMDDGSLIISDEVMALLDGRINIRRQTARDL